MILDADKKGYETTCNIMAISSVQESDVQYALDELAKTPVKAVYIVDSYGALYPIQMRRITELYLNTMKLYDRGTDRISEKSEVQARSGAAADRELYG